MYTKITLILNPNPNWLGSPTADRALVQLLTPPSSTDRGGKNDQGQVC